MSNFSDFIKNSSNENESQNVKKENVSTEKLEEMINSYSTFSKDKLLNEFIKLTIEKKKRGELKPSDIAMLKSTLAPMLNSEQKENLEKILKMVENV